MPSQYELILKKLNKLSDIARNKQILYSDGPLSGAVGCCYILGIDSSSGTIYYKGEDGNWAEAAGGITEFDAVVDFSVNADPNTVGTTFSPNTPEDTTVVYVSTINGSQWTWNGSAYATYNAPYWSKFGNAGTTAGTNYIGTSDNKDLVFKTNNIERLRIASPAASGELVKITNGSLITSGIVEWIECDGLTTGDGLFIRGNSLSGGGSLLNLQTTSTANLTDGAFKLNMAGAHTGKGFYIVSDGLTGVCQDVVMNSVTTGAALALSTTSASFNSTNGFFRVANTSASLTGILARFQSNSTANSGMTILASGKVGVGMSPVEEFDVSGTVRASDVNIEVAFPSASNLAFTCTGAAASNWQIVNRQNGSGFYFYHPDSGGTAAYKFGIQPDGSFGLGTGAAGTAYLEKGTVRGTSAGNCGIDIDPTSKLHVGGSFAAPITSVTLVTLDPSFPITSAHHTISVNNGADDVGVTLPNPTTCVGRIYIIKRKDDSSTGIITISTDGGNVQSHATGVMAATTTLGAWGESNKAQHFQSNGTDWEVIN